jgi:excisionase family DNA binding protein
MHDFTTIDDAEARLGGNAAALRSGMRKRAAGVPTYSVPEAAALLSVSREHLYRLIRVGAFPVLRMGLGADHGRYVVAARTVDELIAQVAPPADVRFARSNDPTSEARIAGAGGR